MASSFKPSFYRAYLLRCWEEKSSSDEEEGVMRFSLENVHTGWKKGFGSLEDLYAFLRTQLKTGAQEESVTKEGLPDCPL